MESYPEPARALVDAMSKAAAAAPERAVAFQGAPGANSHLAANERFPDGLPLPCFSFEDALEAVTNGTAGHAIIPIENSLHGRVADIHFLLPHSGLSIVDEHFLRVRHCLIGRPGPVVTEAMSHPQALGQCRLWLRDRGIKPVAYADTAAAVAAVAAGAPTGVAAIAPSLAAELYRLDVLADGIEDADNNTTRFVVLAQAPRPALGAGPWMTSFTFEVRNVPAALYKAMGCFATNGVNMTKLESYYRDASFAATEFYADIEGAADDPAIAEAMRELAFHTKYVKLLGTYPQARPRTVV